MNDRRESDMEDKRKNGFLEGAQYIVIGIILYGIGYLIGGAL